MQKYWNTVQDEKGNPRYGASVSVQQNGVNSSIYTDSAGLIPAANPLTTDSTRGYFEFYAAAGTYDLSVFGVGFSPYTITGGAILGLPSGDVTFTQSGTGAVARTVQSKERDIISAFDFMSAAEVADVQAKTLGLDVSSSYQKFLNALKTTVGAEGYMPHGLYGIGSRLKLQQTYTSNTCVKLRGEGSGNPRVAATATGGSILVGSTGGILLDCAGGSNITLEDIGFISGTSTPSTIGILGQRIASDPYFTNINLMRVGIGMTPNASANGGLGTFAIVNKRGEHHDYHNCLFYADRPVLCDGSSVYATLISPDYAEAVAGGYTLSVNDMRNCQFFAASGDCVELRSTSQMSISGYMLLQDGKSGVLLGVSNKGIKLDLSAELGAGTPLALVRVASGTAYGLTLKGTTNISTLTAVRTVAGAAVQGAHIELYSGFTAVFDKTTEAGSTMSGAVIKYDSGLGHTVPNANSIYASVLMDGAGGVGAMDLRALNTPTVFNTGGLQPPTTTTGTDTTPVITETYIAEIFVPFTTILTGVAILNGSLVAGNIKAALTNQSGVVLASTASTAASGTAAYQKLDFSATYNAVGPGKYYVLLQCNNVGYRFRSHALGVFGASKKTGETYGTFTTISAPSTFTADLGPIASVY